MTLYIQLLGTPCSGKSTIAHSLYSYLALKGHHIEYVPEFTKKLVYINKLINTSQLKISEEQYLSLKSLDKVVDIVITDTHILNGLVYQSLYQDPDLSSEDSEYLIDLLTSYKKQLGGLTIDVRADINYNPKGRLQSSNEIPKIRTAIDTIIIPLLEPNSVIKHQNISYKEQDNYLEFSSSIAKLGSEVELYITNNQSI